jgi:hypothetical protein
MKCPECKGKRYIDSVNFLKAKREKVICPKCNGFGEIKEAQKDGIRVGRVIGETFFFEELVEYKAIATLEIRVRPIFEGNRPAFTLPKAFGERPRPRVFLEIVRMTTKMKYRKQGIMTKLVREALSDPKIEWATTSWDDSTAEGRNLLIGLGFCQEGVNLVWRPNGENRGSTPSGDAQPEGNSDKD